MGIDSSQSGRVALGDDVQVSKGEICLSTPIPFLVLYLAISLGLVALALLGWRLAGEEAFIPMF